MMGPVIRFCGRFVTSQREKALLEALVRVAHRGLEFDALAPNLEQRIGLLLLYGGAQIVFQRGDLVEQIADFLVHADSLGT
jgi:hypothetical protein